MDVLGFVFPIRPKHADSIFENKKEVFVKFGRRLRNLRVGAKAIFYVSGEKILIGEAVIKSIQPMTPAEAWKKYGPKLFLTREELLEYARMSPLGQERKTKILTVYVLENARKYKKPVILDKRMTLTGYYMTSDEYRSYQ